MTQIRIFGLKACDTCRKALKTLAGAELVDIRDTPMEADALERAYSQFGEALVNTRSTTWRGLDEAARSAPPLELLAAHPPLMKRPLIETGDGTLYLGWSAETRAALGVD